MMMMMMMTVDDNMDVTPYDEGVFGVGKAFNAVGKGAM